MAKKCPKVKKSVKNAGFHSIGSTIRTRRESRCLLYAKKNKKQKYIVATIRTRRDTQYLLYAGFF